jgi:hypothetical protein
MEMENNKQQTVAEWQYIEMAKWFKGLSEYEDSKDILDKAKEMEKKRMIDFADNYVDNCVIPNQNMAIPTIMDVPNYYDQTYGDGKQ